VNRPLQQAQFAQIDLYIFSYILTETRGKWEEFLQDLVASAKPNALFYFAEPTPWQLHHLRNHVLLVAQVQVLQPASMDSVVDRDHAAIATTTTTTSLLDYIWVDSSMNQSADLQAMDGRLGPGALLARKL
jgi:hypothetical protein